MTSDSVALCSQQISILLALFRGRTGTTLFFQRRLASMRAFEFSSRGEWLHVLSWDDLLLFLPADRAFNCYVVFELFSTGRQSRDIFGAFWKSPINSLIWIVVCTNIAFVNFRFIECCLVGEIFTIPHRLHGIKKTNLIGYWYRISG